MLRHGEVEPHGAVSHNTWRKQDENPGSLVMGPTHKPT